VALDSLFDRARAIGSARGAGLSEVCPRPCPTRPGSAVGVAQQGSTGMSEAIPPVSVASEKGVRIVEFTNNKILDEGNIAEIGTTLNALIDEEDRPKLLLDFSNVDHLSSAALGMLINANNRIRQRNGQLRLANIKPQIFEVFVITKLNKLFRILPTRPEAQASFT
jgi:anti-sigma B factor antagonist